MLISDVFPPMQVFKLCRYKNQNPISCVSAYYSTNTWREIYSGLIMPVPDVKDWHIPELIESRVVGTPVNPKQAGRPKTKRIPSGSIIKSVPAFVLDVAKWVITLVVALHLYL